MEDVSIEAHLPLLFRRRWVALPLLDSCTRLLTTLGKIQQNQEQNIKEALPYTQYKDTKLNGNEGPETSKKKYKNKTNRKHTQTISRFFNNETYLYIENRITFPQIRDPCFH